MEKLGIGDEVYDEHGRAHVIRRETDVLFGLDCYRVTFDDGQEVVASASHGWTVDLQTSHGDKRSIETLTTAELATRYQSPSGRRRARMLNAGVDSPDVELPIDPYLLGLWLGDGNRCNGSIAINWGVRDEVEQILAPLLGPHETLTFSHVANMTGNVNIRNKSRHAANCPALIQRLRSLGVLNNKHVPDLYAFAGTEQRRSLLQGLIDSDGCIDTNGRVQFTNVDRLLIEDTRDLICSLGYKPFIRQHSTAGWILSFRVDERPVARLRHKLERQRPLTVQQPRYRYVTNVEKVPSVPVKCIGIDTPTHLFQVERGVVTHNTRNTMTLFPGLFSDDAIQDYKIDVGKEIVYAHGARCRLESVTSSPRTLEGARASFTLKGETQHWLASNEGHKMSEVIARNATKARDGSARALAISNAHNPGEDSDAEHDWEGYQAIAQGKSKGEGFLYDSLEAPPGTDLADEDQLRAGLTAARGDSIWLDIDRHVEEIYDPRNSPSLSRRFYLNQIVAAEDAWVAPHEWDALADPTQVVADGEIVTLGFDGSKTDDHSALMGCRVSDGFLFTIDVWDPARYGGEAPREQIDAAVQRSKDKYDVVGFYSDLHPWESYVDKWMEDFDRTLCVSATAKHPIAWDMRARNQDFTIKGAERMQDAIIVKAFRHDGDPRVRQHVHNARRRPNNWGVSFGKEHRESDRKIDALPAGILARMARQDYLALPPSKQRRARRSGKAMYL